VKRYFFTATPRETRALSMFVEPGDESDDLSVDLRDGLSVDLRDDLSMDSSNETTVEKSRRLVGGLIFEYGFADAM
jgi:hypothetical protein